MTDLCDEQRSDHGEPTLQHTTHITPEEGLRLFLLSVEQAKGGPPPKLVPISPRRVD